MPTSALQPCREPRCPALVVSGHCAAHRSGGRRIEVQRLYNTARWRRLRAAMFAADPCCVACRAAGHVEPWTDLDHVVPHRGDLTLFWDTGNLAGLCKRCHSRKTSDGG